MMAKRGGSDIRRWALMGAEQRLLQLAQEAAAIHAAFPELRQASKGGQARGGGRGTVPATTVKPRRRRRMSAEARKRISEAQKARWAKQRAGGKKR
jgi:hypothetical protein